MLVVTLSTTNVAASNSPLITTPSDLPEINSGSSSMPRMRRMRPRKGPAAIALDRDAGEIGSWESSGVIDVTSLFPTRKGEMLLIADVEAHGINNVNTYDADANGSPDKPWSPIRTNGLEEGGQLFFLGKGGK